MYNSERAKKCLSGLIGWRDHYDTTEIPPLAESLKKSETGEYYQERHPALRLDLIKATLPSKRDLGEYLQEIEDGAIITVLNDLTESKELAKTSKTVVANDVIYNSEGWINDVIINESRFVGIRFRLTHIIGLKAVINRMALQLTQAQENLTIYLYHSNKAKCLAKIPYTTVQGGDFKWLEIMQELHADDEEISGGSFYLGYYQDDLVGQAIQYKKLNWRSGYCGSCDGGVNQARYNSITRYVSMQPFYVPSTSTAVDKEYMFDPSSIIEVDDNNWGFNFNISVNCDLTNFWCDNRKSLKNIIGLMVTIRILKSMQYSQQINHIEEQLKMMIIRDLEGDKETNYVNLYQQYSRAVKALKFDHSSISKVCLPCSVNSGVTYGAV